MALRGQAMETPSDLQIHEYVLSLSAEEQNRITKGPHGTEFTRRVNEALGRVTAEANATKVAPIGSYASRYLDFLPSEVLKDTRPLKPKGEK
jgi:hypothetical protein